MGGGLSSSGAVDHDKHGTQPQPELEHKIPRIDPEILLREMPEV
jgi:hypothetical protein